MALCDRRSDRHGDALPQRPGRHLDSLKLEILRVPGSRAVQLTEVPDVVHRRPLESGQVEQGVDEHRAMPGRQDEPVAVGPARIVGIEL